MHSSLKRLAALVFMSLALAIAPHRTALGQAPAQAAAKPATPPVAAAMPTADQIFDRYLKALGGRAAWLKITSRVSTGTIEVPSMNLSGTVEVREKAPDKMLGIVTISGASFRQAFDGIAGWTDDPQNGLRDQTGAELAESRRDADFYHPLDLHKLYTKFNVTGKDKIGEREVYVIEATVPEGGQPDRMYFDTETSLLLRVMSEHHGLDGVTQIREDFEDYREVDGIKVPFTSHQTNGDTTYNLTINEVRHNVDLGDAEFAKPAAQ
jgi:zinc protease